MSALGKFESLESVCYAMTLNKVELTWSRDYNSVHLDYNGENKNTESAIDFTKQYYDDNGNRYYVYYKDENIANAYKYVYTTEEVDGVTEYYLSKQAPIACSNKQDGSTYYCQANFKDVPTNFIVDINGNCIDVIEFFLVSAT